VTPALKLSQLSPPRRALVRIIQALNYGAILNLTVSKGEVILDPRPDVLIDVRLDEDVGPRSELALDDFTLCTEARRLFAQIDALQNGLIERIVVHGGIPRRVTVRASLPHDADRSSNRD
jgi:hypothetical protein